MKSLLAALVAVLVLPLALPANAQAPDVPPQVTQQPVATHIADDVLGDVKVGTEGQSQSPPSGSDALSPVDLKGLEVVENPDDFAFTLTVASLAPQAEAPSEGNTLYYIHFLQHDRMYRIRLNRQVSPQATVYTARLEGFDAGRGGYYSVGSLAVTDAPATAGMTVTVPKQYALDANGAAPHPEIPITGFSVDAHGLVTSTRTKFGSSATASLTATDAMPDSGNATAQVAVHFGVVQTGHARLSSDTPTRASNGEATTFVFQVKAANLGTAEDTFTLSSTSPPSGWSVKLPASQITVPGNGTVLLPILVTTPFTHVHGSFQNFVVRMTSINDPGSVGAVQLGVRYSQPPQPAGHHNQLWFHSEPASDDPTATVISTAFGGGASAFFNALQNDPADEGADVPADNMGTLGFNGTNVGAQTPSATAAYTWQVPLSPGLEMGLDFDVSAKGTLTLNVKVPAPMPGAVVGGYLAYYGAPTATGTGSQGPAGQSHLGPRTVLADVTPTPSTDMQPNTVYQLAPDVVPRPAADFIPFEQGASLVLVLNLTSTRPDAPFFGTAAPSLAPGGTMTLPLIEYHDPVSDIFLSDVELLVHSAQDRFANPGQVVLYNLTVENHGASDATYLVELSGTNVEWAHLLPANPTATIPGGGSYAFSVIVKVPADVQVPTNPGADKPAADLVLSATNQADFNQHALARLYTTVDTAPHADDSAIVSALEAKADAAKAKSPGFEAAFAMAALGALALVFSRRRAGA